MRTTILVAAASALFIAGCGHANSEMTGPSDNAATGERSFAASDFTSVTLAGSYRVTVQAGDAFSVRASGSQDLLDTLEIEVDDGNLEIRSKDKTNWKFWRGDGDNDGKATIVVTMPRVDGLTLAGSGRLVNNAPTGKDFKAKLAGSGDLETGTIAADSVAFAIAGSGNLIGGAMTAAKTSISIAGSGSLSGKGRSGATKISIAGSGDVDAAEMIASDADIRIMGSGNVDIGATGRAKINIMGSGDVHVSGTSDCTINKAGSGNASCV